MVLVSNVGCLCESLNSLADWTRMLVIGKIIQAKLNFTLVT